MADDLATEVFPSEMTQLERAGAAFARDRAKLFRQDGQPIYGEAEHAQREAALLEQLDATIGSALASPQARATAAQAELARLETLEPLDVLNADEQARAASRREFLKEDLVERPLPQAAARAAALLSGPNPDRADLALVARYGRQRVEAAAQAAATGRAQWSGEDARGLRELGEAANKAALALLDPKGDRKEREAAHHKTVRAASQLGTAARGVRSVADGSEARAMAAMRRQYAGLF